METRCGPDTVRGERRKVQWVGRPSACHVVPRKAPPGREELLSTRGLLRGSCARKAGIGAPALLSGWPSMVQGTQRQHGRRGGSKHALAAASQPATPQEAGSRQRRYGHRAPVAGMHAWLPPELPEIATPSLAPGMSTQQCLPRPRLGPSLRSTRGSQDSPAALCRGFNCISKKDVLES